MLNNRRPWQRSFSRRHVLKGVTLGGAGLAAAGILACGGAERPTTAPGAPGAQQPKRGGILTTDRRITNTPILDPQVDSPILSAYWRLTYQGLLKYNLQTTEVGPELAQRWEQPSETEIIFTLQPGVKWHNKPPVNGRELTVEDVVFSLERVRTNNPRFTSNILLKGVRIEAVDKNRVKLTTPGPEATLLARVSSDAMLILARELLEREGALTEPIRGFEPELMIGTGAFMPKALQEAEPAEFVRNPDYWKPGQPYLDGLRSIPIMDETGNERSWALFQAGQTDVTNVPGTEKKNFLAQPGAEQNSGWAKDIHLFQSAPNTKVAPFDDSRVTKALRLLIDHDEFITAWAEISHGGRGRHGGFLSSILDGWDLTHEEYAQYLEWKQPKDEAVREGLALLRAAGFSRENPFQIEISVSSSEDFKPLAVILDGQYRRFGQGVIVPRIRELVGAAYQTVRAQRTYSFLANSNLGSYFDPDGFFTIMYRSDGPRNYWNWGTPQLDALIDKQRTIFNFQERKKAVQDVLRYLIENAPGSGFANPYILSAWKPYVRGFTPESRFNGRQYEDVWFDK